LFRDSLAQDTGTTTGLTFGYQAGRVLKAGTLTAVSAGTLALPASSESLVYVDFSATPPIVDDALTGVPALETSIVLFRVTTDGTSITEVIDLRNWTMGRTVAA